MASPRRAISSMLYRGPFVCISISLEPDAIVSQVHIPDDDLAGVAAGRGEVAVRREGDAPQPADVPRECLRDLPGLGVVQFHGGVVARGGEVTSGRVEGDGGEVLSAVVG